MTEETPESPPDAPKTYPGLVTLRVAFDTVEDALDFQNSIIWGVQSALEGAKLVEFSAKALDDTDQQELL